MFAALRALRPTLSAAVVAGLAFAAADPAAAQTNTPGASVPALVTPHNAVPPFDLLAVPPGGLPRAPTTRAAPSAPAIPPAGQARDGKYAVTFLGRFAEAGPEIASGVQWRIFHGEPDSNGNLPLAADSKEARPTFRLNPGTYVWHATYGLATRSQYFDVRQDETVQVVIRAGALRFRGLVGDAPIGAEKLRFKLTATEGGVERTVQNDIRPGMLLRLDEGSYHVLSSFGDANAVLEVEVRVQAGRLIDATVHHKAAAVRLKLVRQPNGDALANTSWSVLTPGGDVIRESIGAFPNLILAEGNYTAIARNDGQSFSRDFQVKAGQDVDLELLRP